MDKTEALSRLTFCGECERWKNTPIKQHGYSEKVGYCEKPGQGKLIKMDDDFCSNGRKKDDSLC